MIAVFLDSNILISALVGSQRSAPVVLLDWLAGNPHTVLMTGRCCVQEVERNIARKLPKALPLWRKFMTESAIRVVACPRWPVAGINAKDAAIVAAGIAAKADYFVTGDKRLILEMRAAKSAMPQAMTPREMLEAMVGEST